MANQCVNFDMLTVLNQVNSVVFVYWIVRRSFNPDFLKEVEFSISAELFLSYSVAIFLIA